MQRRAADATAGDGRRRVEISRRQIESTNMRGGVRGGGR